LADHLRSTFYLAIPQIAPIHEKMPSASPIREKMPSALLSCGILLTMAQATDFNSYTDESISLLQLRATARELDVADLQDMDDEDELALLDDLYGDDLALPGKPKIPLQQVGPWGPDGTWNTPYCKDIQGCTPYCPPGCDGAARWMWAAYPNSRLDVPKGPIGGMGRGGPRHFVACEQGKRVPGAVGAQPKVAWMNCLGSENATKAPLNPAGDGLKDNPLVGTDRRLKYPDFRVAPALYPKWSMTPYGYEYCPVDCVNDCAFFQHGNFNLCGVSAPVSGWSGYNRQNSPAVGSNPRCNTDYGWPGQISVYLWCGERTTTTTPLPPPEVEPEVEPEVDPEDEAEAIGDPHMTAWKTGHHFDMAMPEA